MPSRAAHQLHGERAGDSRVRDCQRLCRGRRFRHSWLLMRWTRRLPPLTLAKFATRPFRARLTGVIAKPNLSRWQTDRLSTR